MVNKIENRSKILTYLLIAYFFATPIDYILPHFGNATVLLVLGIVICFFSLFLIFGNSNVEVAGDQSCIILLVAVMVVSNAWAEDTAKAFSFTFSFVATAAMYCMLFFFKFPKKEIELFETASIIGGAVFILYVFTQVDMASVMAGYRLDLGSVGNEEYFSDPNGLAARLVMPTVLLVKRLLEKGKITLKIVYGVLLALMVYIIFLTGSRASVLMLATVFIILFWNFGKKRLGTLLLLGLVAILIVLFIPDLLPEHIYERIFSVESYQDMTTNEDDRLYIWKNVLLKLFPASPLWGYGAGNASVALVEYYGRIKAVHNSLLTILADLGLLGFVPWALFVLGKLKQAYNMRRNNVYVFALMVGVFLMAMTLDGAKEKYLWNGFLYVHLFLTLDDSSVTNDKKEVCVQSEV